MSRTIYFLATCWFEALALGFALAIYPSHPLFAASAFLAVSLRWVALSSLMLPILARFGRDSRSNRLAVLAFAYLFLIYQSVAVLVFHVTRQPLARILEVLAASVPDFKTARLLAQPLLGGELAACLVVFVVFALLLMWLEFRSLKLRAPRMRACVLCFLLASVGITMEWRYSQNVKSPSAVNLENSVLPFSLGVLNNRRWPGVPVHTYPDNDPMPTPATPRRPNIPIFVFIVETLPKRFVDQERTPQLAALMRQALPLSSTLAAANATHLSWHAILASEIPTHYSIRMAPIHGQGAAPLARAASLGYSIRVYDSAGFSYLHAKEAFLPPRNHTIAFSPSFQDRYNWPRTDRAAVDKLIEDLNRVQAKSYEPVFSIIFLGSTHFPYLSTEHKTGELGRMDLLAATFSHARRDAIVSRYLKSLAFVDDQVGRFVSALKAADLFDGSIVVVTGDHGEEFFEKGAFGHQSNLVAEQIDVPIIIKLPSTQRQPETQVGLASHYDIMPTIFGALGAKFKSLAGLDLARTDLEGMRCKTVVNGADYTFPPTHFVAAVGDRKYWFTLNTNRFVFKADRLLLEDATDLKDRPVISAHFTLADATIALINGCSKSFSHAHFLDILSIAK